MNTQDNTKPTPGKHYAHIQPEWSQMPVGEMPPECPICGLMVTHHHPDGWEKPKDLVMGLPVDNTKSADALRQAILTEATVKSAKVTFSQAMYSNGTASPLNMSNQEIVEIGIDDLMRLIAAHQPPAPTVDTGELIKCGNASDNLYLTFKGGCREELNIRDCYRCTGCGGRFHKDCILKHFELEKEHDWGRQEERKALTAELDRLEGFIGISDLCEQDKDQMLIWVKNAKWAVINLQGEDTQAPSKEEK